MITGAGKGIGRATAKMLASRGAVVTAVSRSPADLASLKAEIGGRSIAVDLEDLDRTREVVRAAMPVGLLVNCAAIGTLEPFVDATMEVTRRVMTVNFLSPMVVAQEYARACIARGAPGSIVNVSSDAAFKGLPGHSAYCASKGALDALTRVMAAELGKHSIRVNCINPGVTLTDMGLKTWTDPVRAGPRIARLPLGRFLEPDEVARAILFMLSRDSNMITGVSLLVDSGYHVS